MQEADDETRMPRLPDLLHQAWFEWHSLIWSSSVSSQENSSMDRAAIPLGTRILWRAVRTERLVPMLSSAVVGVEDRSIRALQLQLAARDARK